MIRTFVSRLGKLRTQGVLPTIVCRLRELVRMDRHLEEVVRGAVVAFVIQGLGTGLGFGFNMLLGRLLGAEGAGIYYLALTVTTTATIVGRMGLDNALLRFTASNVAVGNWAKVAGVYRKGMGLAISASFVSTVIVFIGAPWIAQFVFAEPTLVSPLRWMSFGILPMSLLVLHAGLLKGLKRIRDAMLVSSVGIPLLSLPILVMLNGSLGTASAVIAHVVSIILVSLLGVALWRRATPELRDLTGHFDTRLLITTGLHLFGVALMSSMSRTGDTLLLGVWASSKSVGIYGIATRTAVLTNLVLLPVNSIVSAKFAALYTQGDFDALSALTRNTARLVTFFAVLVVLPLIVVPQWVLRLFGQDFVVGAPVLAILAIGQFVRAATGSLGPLLIMSGHEKVLQRLVMFSVAVNLLLGVILIPDYGLLGAAITRAFSLILLSLLALRAVYKHLGISLVSLRKGQL